MSEDDAMLSDLARHLQRVDTASGEATRLTAMNLERRNLLEELLGRVGTIVDAANDARRALVLDALAEGMSVRDTAHAAGIGPSTVQRWKAEL